MKKEGVIFSLVLAFVNILLVSLKIIIGFFSNSVSVLADAFNNLGDFFTCSSSAYGFSVSNKKPNRKHPHGYGRVEYVLSLLFTFVVVIVGTVFIKDSLQRLFEPGIIAYRKTFLYILLISAFIKLLMSIVTFIVNKDVKSPMFKMIGIDNLQDFFISLLTCLSFYLSSSKNGDLPIDGIFGTIIGVILISKAIYEIIKLTKKLLGDNLEKKDLKEILELFKNYNLIINDMISHDYGPKNKYLVITILNSKNDVDNLNEKIIELKKIMLEKYLTKLTAEIQYIEEKFYKDLEIANEILNDYIGNIKYDINENNLIINIHISLFNKNNQINKLLNDKLKNYEIKYFE